MIRLRNPASRKRWTSDQNSQAGKPASARNRDRRPRVNGQSPRGCRDCDSGRDQAQAGQRSGERSPWPRICHVAWHRRQGLARACHPVRRGSATSPIANIRHARRPNNPAGSSPRHCVPARAKPCGGRPGARCAGAPEHVGALDPGRRPTRPPDRSCPRRAEPHLDPKRAQRARRVVRKAGRKRSQQARPRFAQDDPSRCRPDAAEVAGQRGTRKLRDSARQFHPGQAATNDNEGQQPARSRRDRCGTQPIRTRSSSRSLIVSASSRRLEHGRVRRPFVMAEPAIGGPGRQYQVVESNSPCP